MSQRSSYRAEEVASLTLSAVKTIRTDILTGTLEPSERLKIEDLRNRYQIGASPIREALSQLCADGLVVRLNQRGFRVAPVSLEEFDDLIECRCRLEELALRDSIAAGDEAWEERVVLAFHRLSRVSRSADPMHFVRNPTWEILHKDFHTALLEGGGSRHLKRFCDQLYDQAMRYRAVADISAYPRRDIHGEHQQIMEATIARQPDEAVAALHSHYRETGKYLGEVLTERRGWTRKLSAAEMA